MSIRTAVEEDFEDIAQIDGEAFADWARREGRVTDVEYRTRTNLVQNRRSDPEGCFIAEDAGKPVGFIFNHTWGTLGWVGTFGVLPSSQGKGIGKQLLRASIDYLEVRGCSTIGLETMPSSKENIGLYLAHGFHPDFFTLLFARDVKPERACNENPMLIDASVAASKLSDALTSIRQISDAVEVGLDYSNPARLLVEGGEGEIAIFGCKIPWGFAALRTKHTCRNREMETLVVEFAAIMPGEEKRIL